VAKSIVIVGPVAAGKSTICSELEKYYENSRIYGFIRKNEYKKIHCQSLMWLDEKLKERDIIISFDKPSKFEKAANVYMFIKKNETYEYIITDQMIYFRLLTMISWREWKNDIYGDEFLISKLLEEKNREKVESFIEDFSVPNIVFNLVSEPEVFYHRMIERNKDGVYYNNLEKEDALKAIENFMDYIKFVLNVFWDFGTRVYTVDASLPIKKNVEFITQILDSNCSYMI